jgi:hypothetical protein
MNNDIDNNGTETTVDEVELSVTTTSIEVVKVETGVIMTGETPETLLEELTTNLRCIYSLRDTQSQQACLNKIVGDNRRSIAQLLQRRVDRMNDFYRDYPDAQEYSINTELLEGEFYWFNSNSCHKVYGTSR